MNARQAVALVLTEYVGRRIRPESLKVVVDPVFPQVHGVRWIAEEVDFLVTLTGNVKADADLVEEVTFPAWPPYRIPS